MTSFVAAVEDAERAQLIVDLKAARAALVTRGRCRGQFVKDDKVCAIGAIGVATLEGFEHEDSDSQYETTCRDVRLIRAVNALARRLSVLHPDAVNVWRFNDDLLTTDQDVLDLFDKTLADLGGLG